jgi:hypothetical protein
MTKTQMEEKLEEFEAKISAIQQGIKQMRRTGIREKTLLILVQKSSQRFMPKSSVNQINLGEVKAVIQGIEGLRDFIFKPETSRIENK